MKGGAATQGIECGLPYIIWTLHSFTLGGASILHHAVMTLGRPFCRSCAGVPSHEARASQAACREAAVAASSVYGLQQRCHNHMRTCTCTGRQAGPRDDALLD